MNTAPPKSEAFFLADADFDRFREFFYRTTGIQFSPTKRYFVDKRIGACVEDSGRGTFVNWFADIRLDRDPRGLQELINRLTVNETYFFREMHQFDALVNEVLPRVVAARPRGPVRILCLPCSTGEEPYSVALTLLERWPGIDSIDVEIVGSDIDTGVVDAARTGVYGKRSLEHVPPSTLARHFTSLGAGRYAISDDIRGAVDLRVANVCDSASMRKYRDFDVVFCRNVLIYFDAPSSRLAAENLYGALRPGGYLFLGHAESMSRISPIFDPVSLNAGIVYRRPEASK